MIFASPAPAPHVPPVSFAEFLLAGCRERGAAPAFIDALTGRTVTYTGLAESAEEFAAGLSVRGLGRGDVVALLSQNAPEYPVAFIGAILAGCTVTTINALLTAREIAEQLRDSGARMLVTAAELGERATEAAVASPRVPDVVVLGDTGAGSVPALLAAGRAALTSGSVPVPDVDPAPDVAVMLYSSGTTGVSKGVMLTHGNLVAAVLQCDAWLPPGDGDTVLAVLPFSHVYGAVILMSLQLWRGVPVVCFPRFDLEGYLRAAQEYRSRTLYVVPPIVAALAKHPVVDQFTLSVERVITGAAPLGEDVERACGKRLGCLIGQAWGMSECALGSASPLDRPELVRPGSSGPLVPGCEARFLDPVTGAELGPGERGELWLRGPNVMAGYLNRPAETAATLVDGWLRTGDIGYADPDGWIYIVDRAKELIKYKAFAVAPAELEALLLTHPGVLDAAVVPSPDEEAGEVPKAFVVPRGDLDLSALESWAASQVAPHKRIRRFEVIAEIPRTASGKILRRVLIERERERAGLGRARLPTVPRVVSGPGPATSYRCQEPTAGQRRRSNWHGDRDAAEDHHVPDVRGQR